MKKMIPIVVLVVVVVGVGGFWIGTRHSSTSVSSNDAAITVQPEEENHFKDFYGVCERRKLYAEQGKPIMHIDPKDDPCKDYK